MLRAGGTFPDGRRFVLAGLSHTNLQRLRDGEPIVAPLSQFGLGIDGDLVIMSGKDENDVMRQLRECHVEIKVPDGFVVGDEHGTGRG